MVVALEVRGPGSKTDSSPEHVGWAQDGEQSLLAVRRPGADLDLAGNDDVQQVAGGEHGVPAGEVGGLQLAGEGGRRVGLDSLEDSSLLRISSTGGPTSCWVG